MDLQELKQYIVPVAIVSMFFGLKVVRAKVVKAKIPALLKQGAVVVDVRTPREYAAGARSDSLNIPLDTLESNISKLDRNKPVIVCCASGVRSSSAANILKKNGFQQVMNAGPWQNTL